MIRNRIPAQPRVNFVAKDGTVVVRAAAQQPRDELDRQRVILFHRPLESGAIECADLGEHKVSEFLAKVHSIRAHLPGAAARLQSNRAASSTFYRNLRSSSDKLAEDCSGYAVGSFPSKVKGGKSPSKLPGSPHTVNLRSNDPNGPKVT